MCANEVLGAIMQKTECVCINILHSHIRRAVNEFARKRRKSRPAAGRPFIGPREMRRHRKTLFFLLAVVSLHLCFLPTFSSSSTSSSARERQIPSLCLP